MSFLNKSLRSLSTSASVFLSYVLFSTMCFADKEETKEVKEVLKTKTSISISTPKPKKAPSSGFTNADGVSVKLKGGFDFMGVYRDTDLKSKRLKPLSANNKSFAFISDATMAVVAENKTEYGLTYGAQIVLETTAQNIKRAASGLYLSAPDIGKIELGSDSTPHTKMKINGFSVVTSATKSWDSYSSDIDPKANYSAWVAAQASYIDSKMRTSGKSEFARKISYYSPKFKGFQIGIGYVPDTTNGGGGASNSTDFHDPVKLSTKETVDIKNGLAGGISYEGAVGEKAKIKLSLIGEYGEAVPRDKKEGKLITDKKFNDLLTWAVGGQVTIEKISFAIGYYYHGKSLLPKDTKRTPSGVGSVGLGYNFDNGYTTSISYLRSNNKNHELHAVSWGSEYKLAPGLMPYGMLTYYNGSRTGGEYGDEKGKNTDKLLDFKVSGFLVAAGINIQI